MKLVLSSVAALAIAIGAFGTATAPSFAVPSTNHAVSTSVTMRGPTDPQQFLSRVLASVDPTDASALQKYSEMHGASFEGLRAVSSALVSVGYNGSEDCSLAVFNVEVLDASGVSTTRALFLTIDERGALTAVLQASPWGGDRDIKKYDAIKFDAAVRAAAEFAQAHTGDPVGQPQAVVVRDPLALPGFNMMINVQFSADEGAPVYSFNVTTGDVTVIG